MDGHRGGVDDGELGRTGGDLAGEDRRVLRDGDSIASQRGGELLGRVERWAGLANGAVEVGKAAVEGEPAEEPSTSARSGPKPVAGSRERSRIGLIPGSGPGSPSGAGFGPVRDQALNRGPAPVGVGRSSPTRRSGPRPP